MQEECLIHCTVHVFSCVPTGGQTYILFTYVCALHFEGKVIYIYIYDTTLVRVYLYIHDMQEALKGNVKSLCAETKEGN